MIKKSELTDNSTNGDDPKKNQREVSLNDSQSVDDVLSAG